MENFDKARAELEAAKATIAAQLSELEQRRIPLQSQLDRVTIAIDALGAVSESRLLERTPPPSPVRNHSGKYRPLWSHLMESGSDHLSMSFKEVEEVLRFPLPYSSRAHLSHWYGYKGSAVARAVRDAGWRARNVNLHDETVEFVRVVQQEGSEVSAERSFEYEMMQIYERAKAEIGYTASRFLQMVLDQGGLATAERLLHSPSTSDGFTKLWESKRLDLSVEALVIRPEFSELFTGAEKAIARSRLDQFGFNPIPEASVS